MKNVIIVGSGAVAAELTSYIEHNNAHSGNDEELNILGYLDFQENILKYWSRYKFRHPVLNDIHQYKIQEDDHFIVGIADIEFRSQMINVLKAKSAKIIGFTHYTSIVAHSALVGIGNLIYPHCIVGPNTSIGDNNLLTSYSFVSHDCKVGSNNFFSTAGVGGNAVIGDYNFFGIRATVLPGISVGNKNIIQAGMIVDKGIGNNSVVFHRFREKIIAIKSSTDNE